METNKLILIVGLPGTGKTTFAAALSSAINAHHLNSDMLRQQAGMRGHYDTASKTAIYDTMLEKTEEYLKAHHQVVIDATFYKNSLRNPYQLLAKKYSIDIKWIEIRAEENIIKERVDKKRQYSEADFEVYKKIKEDYEPLEMAHLILWSDRLLLGEMVKQAQEFLAL